MINVSGRNIYLAFILILLVSGCKQQPGVKYSHLRFANFLLPAENVKVKIKGKMNDELTLKYGESSGYQKIPEGEISITVTNKFDSLVLKKVLGIGNRTKFTVTFSGIIPENLAKNHKTFKTRLLDIFEGAASHPANAGMPVAEVFLDRYEGNSGKGNIKLVHMAPSVSETEFYLREEDKFEKLTTVSYPEPSSRNYSLKPGVYPFQIRFKSSEIVLCSGEVTIKAKELTTVFIYGDKDSYPYQLKVKILSSD